MTERRAFLRGMGAIGTGLVVAGCARPSGIGDGGDTTAPGTATEPTTTEQTTEQTTTTTEQTTTTTEATGTTGETTTTAETTETTTTAETTETTTSGTTASGDVLEVDAGPEGRLRFVPEDVEVPVGGTVRWVFLSPGHNVTSKPGASEKCRNPEGAEPFASYEGDQHFAIVPEGETYEHTFTVAGEYVYVCEPHADQGMVGTVTVSE